MTDKGRTVGFDGWPESDEEFWNASVPVTVATIHARTLCPTDQIFHACAHAEASRVYYDSPAISWAADAMAVLTRVPYEINWERFVAIARDRNLGHAVYTCLVYLRRVLHAPVADAVLAELETLPLSWPERIEQASTGMKVARARRILNLVSQFLRLRRQRRFRPLLMGPVRFLADYWAVDRIRQVAPLLVRKSLKNVRALVKAQGAQQDSK